jgi:hypothetical protein
MRDESRGLELKGRSRFCRKTGRCFKRRVCLEFCWQRSVDAARRRGVVRVALSSPEWGSPGEETTERDGKARML